jgi:hypothetical protein
VERRKRAVTTPAKVAANRENALESTGPRTPEGKAVSSKNALRHGLLSVEVLLPDEPAEDLEAFRGRLHEALQPEGELEELLFDRIASTAWRLRRVLAVEAGLFTRHEDRERAVRPVGLAASFRYVSHYEDREGLFSRLSRYEAALERSLYRALHELQRLQALRAGQASPLPVAVDVTFSGSDREA